MLDWLCALSVCGGYVVGVVASRCVPSRLCRAVSVCPPSSVAGLPKHRQYGAVQCSAVHPTDASRNAIITYCPLGRWALVHRAISLARCGLCGHRRGEFLSVLPRAALAGSLAAVRFFVLFCADTGRYGVLLL